MRLLALALTLPLVATLVELAALWAVGRQIGLAWALLILLGTCIVGGLLLRRAGTRTWRRLRSALDDGRAPGPEVSDGLAALTAAGLIAFPGFVTDILGGLLLLPPLRRAAGSLAQRLVARRMSSEAAGHLFGPRKVRVHQQRPSQTTKSDTPLEGEIVEPDRSTAGRL